MSRSKLVPLTCKSVLAMAFFAAVAAGIFAEESHDIRPSQARLHTFVPHGLVAEKQASAMTVEIVGPESYPENSQEQVELLAYVTQYINSDSPLQYTWSLPEGVQAAEGDLSGNLEVAPLGQAQALRLVVRGFTHANKKQILLHTSLLQNGMTLKGSAVVVSRPEETTEATAMVRRAASTSQ